ncbi:hypothetical protein WN944_008893 [Citrus x changshan-huyou]|uniref:RING-type E3 ubiquitin transferase n=1 Tax=Citrus x changshan-huyou TaxID=2935761 RepID=A0AAP0MNR4_9ROSI
MGKLSRRRTFGALMHVGLRPNKVIIHLLVTSLWKCCSIDAWKGCPLLFHQNWIVQRCLCLVLCRAGLTDEGCNYVNIMSKEYGNEAMVLDADSCDSRYDDLILTKAPRHHLQQATAHRFTASDQMRSFVNQKGIAQWHTKNITNDNDNNGDVRLPVKAAAEGGLSASELDKLPKISGKELVMGTECAVCLDEVESEQPARLVPGCNHGFHLQCADSWLSKHSVCPVCRAKLDSHFFNALYSDNPC